MTPLTLTPTEPNLKKKKKKAPSSDVGTWGGLGHGSRVRRKDEGTPLAAPGLRLCASTAGMQVHSLLRELGPRKPPARGQSALGSPRPC